MLDIISEHQLISIKFGTQNIMMLS